MVKLYDKNFREEDFDKLETGDVIVYPSGCSGMYNYLIVSSVDKDSREISGQLATTIGVNGVLADDIVSKCKL